MKVPVELMTYIDHYKSIIDNELEKQLHKLTIPNQLKQSMLYSIQAGGKGIRPILLIASNQAYDHHLEKTLSTAVALEMIHTYSLIHDDLPAMDNDDYRRGKLTNHKVFDESTAILAGDALLTYSFEIISEDPHLTSTEKVKIISMLAKKSGPKGMVAGQILDMKSEVNSVTLDELENIHRLKTGQLLRFSILAGAFLGNASAKELMHLETYSNFLGLIFQVQDDILDVVGDEETIGKPIGSDEDNQKSTYPKLLGLDGARQKKLEYVHKAKKSLIEANAAGSQLVA